MTDAKPGSPLAWAQSRKNFERIIVDGSNTPVADIATSIIEMEKALAGLLSAHAAHHNMPEHAAARAALPPHPRQQAKRLAKAHERKG